MVQFCANDPETLLAAARIVEPHADAVDLNLGCPQRIARRGRYGETMPHCRGCAVLDSPARLLLLFPSLVDNALARTLNSSFIAGAFLMDDLPLVEQIVRTCSEGLSVPVTVKIRIFPDRERTVEYARMLERAGASLIAVHGRLREQKKSQGPDADWDAIKVISSLQAALP